MAFADKPWGGVVCACPATGITAVHARRSLIAKRRLGMNGFADIELLLGELARRYSPMRPLQIAAAFADECCRYNGI